MYAFNRKVLYWWDRRMIRGWWDDDWKRFPSILKIKYTKSQLKKVVLPSDNMRGVCSCWSEADFKCTSHWEGASRHQAATKRAKSARDVWQKLFSQPEQLSPREFPSKRRVCRLSGTPLASERRLSSENKAFKSAMTPARFPPRAPGDFF